MLWNVKAAYGSLVCCLWRDLCRERKRKEKREKTKDHIARHVNLFLSISHHFVSLDKSLHKSMILRPREYPYLRIAKTSFQL